VSKDLRCFFLTFVFLLSSGCRHFVQVDLKYSSDAHLAPAARFLEVHTSPQTASKLVDEYVKRNQGRVELSESKLPFRFVPASNSESAFRAARRVFEQEWEAYAAQSPRRYRGIDRSDPLLSTPEVLQVADAAANTWWVRASILPRSAQIFHARETTYFSTTWATNEAVETRLYVWWWAAPKGKTIVYARGVPFMRHYQAEAAPGAVVDWQLWKVTNGAVDAALVRELFAFIGSKTRDAQK